MIGSKMFVIIMCLQFFFAFTKTSELPSYVHICKRNLPDFSKCIINTSYEMRSYIGKGIPEMGLFPVDPLKIPHIAANIGKSNINLDLQIKDATVYNLSKFNVSYFAARPDIGRFTSHFLLDNVDIEGNYVLKGKVLTFAIDGKGFFTFNSTDLSVQAEWFGDTVIKNKEEYLKFTKLTCKINTKDMQLYAYDLFEGNDKLTETVNKIINDNIEELKKDFDVVLEELVGNFTLSYFNGIYGKFPLNVLFPLD